jgi:hypothetical protein
MNSHTTKGRVLAIAAGIAFAAGGLTILLDKELLHPLDWAASQWLTILTVFGTIAAGHLMADAARARHVFATIGFLALFLSGTGLVVYNSVGRQVETAGITTLSVEDANGRLADLKAERTKAVARRDYADQQAAFEIAGRPNKRGRPTIKPGCGTNCQDWKQNSRDVSAAIENLDREIAKIGPAKPVNAQAAAMADVVMLFGTPVSKDQIIAALTLLIPFAKCLFFEIGSIVSLGFAFRSSPSISKQKSFSEIKDEALKHVEPSPLVGMFSGELPDPTPPKPRKRKKPGTVSAPNVISFQQHPVVKALKSNGGAVSSNQELADLMNVSKGEASKRWQEIEDQLILTRDGKHLRIALKA